VTEPWPSADGTAAHLDVTRGSGYAWIAEKGMPTHTIARLRRFQPAEVDDRVRGGGLADSLHATNSR
jgi:hypothetical protein